VTKTTNIDRITKIGRFGLRNLTILKSPKDIRLKLENMIKLKRILLIFVPTKPELFIEMKSKTA
jgi:hypothetical protein